MRKVTISVSELQEIYDTLTVKEAKEKLNVCTQTYYNMLDAAKIERKKKNFVRGQNIRYEIVD